MVASIPGEFVLAIPGFCQPVSSLSHLAAAAVALVAGFSLVRLARGCRRRASSVAVYVVCVIASMGISGAYHALDRGCAARAVMQRLDHFAIWLLIAGTFTAIHGIMFSGVWRRGALTFIWSYVAVALLLQGLWFQVFSGVAGLALYLGLGWLGIFSVVKLGRQLGFPVVRPVWYAGIAYSAGAILEATGHPILLERWVRAHEIFHIAVILGVALHWLFIRRLLVRHAPALEPAGIAPALSAAA